MPGRDYANSRYSTLAQITSRNAGALKVAWTFSTGVLRGHEGQPLVVDNTMYLVTPYPNVAYAIDLTQPGYPLKWKYRPENAQAATGVACCDVVNRGAAYADGKLVYNLLDGHTVGVDAATGKQLWRTKMAALERGETITMAPIIVKNRAIVGSSGGEMGVRGWVAAIDINTGKEVWRAYNTGPDADVKIGPRFKPFYATERGANLGVTSWPTDAWKIGGGAAWGWVSYDPSLNLVYYGTSNPGPWNQEQRPGDNKWTAGVFARDADTGEAVWFYQMSPHDLWDYDGVNEQVLADLPIGGGTRKVMMRADRDGYLYVIDRTNGEVISADPFVAVTSTKGVDLKTGRPIENEELHPSLGKVVRNICPASPGGKDWQPMAYSTRTGLVYIPGNNLCMDFEGVEANYIAGTPFVGANVRMYAGPGGNRGEFIAWDPIARRKVWSIKESFPVWSGVAVTASDVAFYGTMDGWFKALDARTGAELWKFHCGSGIIANPITYLAPDGKQYLAVYSGIGGWMGAVAFPDISIDDPYAALGVVGAMKEIKKHSSAGDVLYVFGL